MLRLFFVCISLADTFFTRCYKNVRDTDLGLGFSTGGDLQIKIIATSGCMTAAKCIKFVSGRARLVSRRLKDFPAGL